MFAEKKFTLGVKKKNRFYVQIVQDTKKKLNVRAVTPFLPFNAYRDRHDTYLISTINFPKLL